MTTEELFRLCVQALNECPDIEATIKRMKPNNNTIALGLIALFDSNGMSEDEIIERFRKAGEK